MKRILFLVFTLSVLAVNSYTQDTIFLINRSNIKAKVLEVNEGNVRYKLFNFQDGPIYSINKNEIHVIKYPNGMKDVFNIRKSKVKEIEQPQISDTIFRPFLFGVGFGFGIFNPSDYNNYVREYAKNNGLNQAITSVYSNASISGFVGYRFSKQFEINVIGGYANSINFTSNKNGIDQSLNYDKVSFGLIGNMRIPIQPRYDLTIAAGVLQNYMMLTKGGRVVNSGNSLGYRLQGWLNFYITKLFTLQGLIGGEYASAQDKAFVLNYSGFLFTVNAILNK